MGSKEPGQSRKPEKGGGYLQAFGLIGILGLSMVLPILFAVLLGAWLDARFGGHGLFVIGAVILGVAAGFYGAYQRIKKELPWNH